MYSLRRPFGAVVVSNFLICEHDDNEMRNFDRHEGNWQILLDRTKEEKKQWRMWDRKRILIPVNAEYGILNTPLTPNADIFPAIIGTL